MIFFFLDYGFYFVGWGFIVEIVIYGLCFIMGGVFDYFFKLIIVLGYMGEGLLYWL